MSTFNELQSLWQGADISPHISAADMRQKVRTTQAKLRLKSIAGILSLIATIVVMFIVLAGFHPVYITTRIGIALVLLAVAGAIIVNLQMLRLLHSSVMTEDNSSSLALMLRYQRAMRSFHARGITVYFILLTTGLSLYLGEFAHRSMSFALISYALTLAWIAFAWWYIRPRSIRKQTAKLDEMIIRLRGIQQELEADAG